MKTNDKIINKILTLSIFLILLFLLWDPAKIKTINKIQKQKIFIYIDNSFSQNKQITSLLNKIKKLSNLKNISIIPYLFGETLQKYSIKETNQPIGFDSKTYFTSIIRHQNNYGNLKDKVIVISDFSFSLPPLYQFSSNFYYYNNKIKKKDITIYFSPNNPIKLKPNVTNELSFVIEKNFKKKINTKITLNIQALPFGSTNMTSLDKKTYNISLSKNNSKIEINFNIFPKQNIYYILSTEIKPQEKKQIDFYRNNNKDFYIYKTEQKKTQIINLVFSPDYDVKQIKSSISKFPLLKEKSYYFYSTKISDKEKLKKIKEKLTNKNVILILYSPPLNILKYLDKNNYTCLYIPLKDTNTAEVFFNQKIKINNNKKIAFSELNNKYNFFNLSTQIANNQAWWNQLAPFQKSYNLNISNQFILYQQNENHKTSYFFKFNNIIFLGLYPIRNLNDRILNSTSQSTPLDTFIYYLIQELSQNQQKNKIPLSEFKYNFSPKEALQTKITSHNIKINNKKTKNKKKLWNAVKTTGLFFLQEEKNNISYLTPISIRIPINEKINNPVYPQKQLKDITKLINDIKHINKISTRKIKIQKKHYFFRNKNILYFLLILFILYSVLKKKKT